MDCNNNDGTNYIYQMQQTMNSALMSNSSGSMPSAGLPPHSSYDKKPFDLGASNNPQQPQYQQLNGHHPSHSSPANGSGGPQYNAPHSIYSQQPAPAPPPPTVSSGANRQPPSSPYSDFNNFNHVPPPPPSANYYGAYPERGLHFSQPPAMSHPAHVNHHPTHHHPPHHPMNHHHSSSAPSSSSVNQLNHHAPVNPSSHPTNHQQQLNPIQSNPVQKEQRGSVPLPYDHPHHPSSTNPTTIYNHHLQSNHHQLPPTSGHLSHPNPSQMLNNHHHHPQQQQPPPPPPQQHHHAHRFGVNSNAPPNSAGFSQSAYQQQPFSLASNSPLNQQHPNYYPNNYGYPPPPLANNASSPPQQSPTSAMLQQQQQQSNPVQMNSGNQVTNLNNSANLSQPYANMHISNSGGNPMNSSLSNGPIGQQQQQQQANSGYMQMQNSNCPPNYMQTEMNSAAAYRGCEQFLASPPPGGQPLSLSQYHSAQPISSPHPNLNSNSNSNSSCGSNQRAKASKSKNSNNVVGLAGTTAEPKRQATSMSSVDETLDAVVNAGLKPKRKRNKSKAKEKGGKKG